MPSGRHHNQQQPHARSWSTPLTPPGVLSFYRSDIAELQRFYSGVSYDVMSERLPAGAASAGAGVAIDTIHRKLDSMRSVQSNVDKKVESLELEVELLKQELRHAARGGGGGGGSQHDSRRSGLGACVGSDVCLDTLMEYSQHSTCHGVNYIFHSGYKFLRRLVWIMFCLCCTSTMFYFSSRAVIRYMSFPSVSTIKVHQQDSIEFPAVTICNVNQIRKSYYEREMESGTIPAFGSLAEFMAQQVRLGKLRQTNMTVRNTSTPEGGGGQLEEAEAERALYESLDAVDLEDFYTKAGHQFANTLVDGCDVYANRQIYCNVTSFIHYTRHTLCHRITMHYADAGGNPAADPEADRLRSTQRDHEHLVLLALDPQEAEYRTQVTPSLLINFHPHNEVPDQNGFMPVEMGRLYYFFLQKTAAYSLPRPWGECLDTRSDDFTNPLTYFSHYSKTACQLECRSRVQAERCGCRSLGFPGLPDVPVCNYTTTYHPAGCLNSIRFQVTCPHCFEVCNRTLFEVRQSSVSIKTEEKHKDRVLVSFQFRELTFTEIVQSEGYPAESLFGEVGGQLGLFAGASILTIIECVDLVIMLVIGRMTRCGRLKAGAAGRFSSTSSSRGLMTESSASSSFIDNNGLKRDDSIFTCSTSMDSIQKRRDIHSFHV